MNALDQDVMTPPILSVDGISVHFAGVKALTDVSFQVMPGELFAVIGPNGAGKTSLFNVLSRVYQPIAGRVTFDGRNLLQLKTHQVAHAGIARTFQNLGQFPTATVLDYLLLGRHIRMLSDILRGGISFIDDEVAMHVGNRSAADAGSLQAEFIDQFAGRDGLWVFKDAARARRCRARSARNS